VDLRGFSGDILFFIFSSTKSHNIPVTLPHLTRSFNIATREAAAQKETAEREMKFLKDSEERMKTQFENLANSIFEAKGKTLTEGNQTSMTALLQPL